MIHNKRTRWEFPKHMCISAHCTSILVYNINESEPRHEKIGCWGNEQDLHKRPSCKQKMDRGLIFWYFKWEDVPLYYQRSERKD